MEQCYHSRRRQPAHGQDNQRLHNRTPVPVIIAVLDIAGMKDSAIASLLVELPVGTASYSISMGTSLVHSLYTVGPRASTVCCSALSSLVGVDAPQLLGKTAPRSIIAEPPRFQRYALAGRSRVDRI